MIHRSESIAVYPAQSDTVLIIFGHRDADRFAFWGPTSNVGVSRIFVRDLSLRGWYNRGVDAEIDSVRKLRDRLAFLVSELGARRVLTLGSSMGGYAAILFGGLFSAERVLAFNPQTLLDRAFPLSPPSEHPIHIADLTLAIMAARETIFQVVVSEDDAVDLFHAAHVYDAGQVQVSTAAGSSHLITEELHRHGRLSTLIEEWVDCGTLSVLEPAPAFASDHFREAVIVGVPAFMRGDHEAAIPALGAAVAVLPHHPGLRHFLGEALVRRDRHDEAEAPLREALARRPHWSETAHFLGLSLAERGLFAEAEPFFDFCERHNPYSWPENTQWLARCRAPELAAAAG